VESGPDSSFQSFGAKIRCPSDYLPSSLEHRNQPEIHMHEWDRYEEYNSGSRRFSDVLQPGRYSLVVEYSSSAFPWVLAGETMNEVQESAKKLKYAAVLGKFLSNEVTFTVAK
jgi:hypothetical protein